jgi:hypothetical protein
MRVYIFLKLCAVGWAMAIIFLSHQKMLHAPLLDSRFFVRQPLVIDQVSIKNKKWCVLWLNREAGSIIYAEVMVTELEIIKFLNLSPPC